MPKAGNHWFASYNQYYKKKLGITEFTYDPCLFYRSDLLEIVGMQTDDTLILADNISLSKKKEAIKATKIIIKDCEYLTFT